jgi:mRNA interferase RelE/StbE
MGKDVLVFYTSSSRKDLKKLDSKIAQKIVKTVFTYTSKNSLEKAKKLSGIFEGLYRYRIGEYRVIFQYKNKEVYIVTILKIKHRKDIYKA